MEVECDDGGDEDFMLPFWSIVVDAAAFSVCDVVVDSGFVGCLIFFFNKMSKAPSKRYRKCDETDRMESS